MRHFALATAIFFALFGSIPAFAQGMPNTIVTENGKTRIYGANGKESWYDIDPLPATLKAALVASKEFHGDRVLVSMKSMPATYCEPFASVKLACDYDTRITLSRFLSVNGKGLFPSQHKEERVNDAFIGLPAQNEMLRAAVVRNLKLFKNGDLTAEDVRKNWK